MKKYILIGIISIILIVVITFIVITSINKKANSNIAGLFDSKNYDQAIVQATEKLATQPDELETLLLLAATYAQKGSVSFKEDDNALKAIEYADKAIAIDINSSEAYRIKGYAYEIMEKYKEAHENYDKAIVLDPKNSLAISNKGHAYQLEGREDKALALYESSLKINPNNSHALLNLARLQAKKSKFEEAKITLNGLFASTPHVRFEAEGYQLLAFIYLSEQDYDGAFDAIEKSISLDDTVPQSWVLQAQLNFGTLLDAESDAELQEILADINSDLQKALSINPNQTSAYILLSEIQVVTGDKATREEYKKKALEAVDLDITLGKSEKESARRYLNSKIKVIN